MLSVTATTTNQISGDTFDAAGNLITIPAIANYTYDAENHLKTAAGVTYTYDGDGKRVRKSTGKLYWYGMSSDPLDETDLTGVITNAAFKEYVFFAGQRIARRDSTNAVNYYFADHLGTARIVANSSGTILDDSDFYPFGGERVVTSSSGNRYKFTGKERDSESGLDNFGARYDSSSLGRFMSPDPLMASAKVWDPQTWNRYSYARNNPLLFIDPTGMKEVTAEECQKDPHCVTLKLNVVYDQNTNNGKGLTDKQKADFEKNQLQYAKDEYGNADIHLDVTYTPGAVTTDDKGNTQISGLQAGALNVVVTDQVRKGGSGINEGMAASFIPANSTDKQELAHEIAHHLAGDTQGWRAWVVTHDPDYTGYLLNGILDAGNKSERIWMNTFDKHSGAFSHYPLASAFNNNARVFQKMIQPTTKPQ